VTDFISFYNLPSSVVNHPIHKTLKASYSFYNVSNQIPLKDLYYDALIIAKKGGADVFNALDIMDNGPVFEDLKFGIGDGNLHYYLYNWKCPEIDSSKVIIIIEELIKVNDDFVFRLDLSFSKCLFHEDYYYYYYYT
jgi:glycylpeptide N-tetradecanoyltransferase